MNGPIVFNTYCLVLWGERTKFGCSGNSRPSTLIKKEKHEFLSTAFHAHFETCASISPCHVCIYSLSSVCLYTDIYSRAAKYSNFLVK